MSTRKELSLSALASFVGSLSVLLPVLWFVGKPIISTALAEDFKQVAQAENAPIKSAFSVLLTRDINGLRREIAALKFRQSQSVNWTEDEAAYLADLEIELDSLREAKAQLDKPPEEEVE